MVDFWAAWCGPCRMVGPIIDQISEEYSGKAVVGKVDVDANQEFAAKYGVRNIPTVLVFKNGEVVGGLCRGIERAGVLLAQYCPPRPGDNPNELPDELIRGN